MQLLCSLQNHFSWINQQILVAISEPVCRTLKSILHAPHQCGKISNASSLWKDIQCLINVERYSIPHQCGKISNASLMWKDTQCLINVETTLMRHWISFHIDEGLDIFPHWWGIGYLSTLMRHWIIALDLFTFKKENRWIPVTDKAWNYKLYSTQCLINVERYSIPHHCGKIFNASSMCIEHWLSFHIDEALNIFPQWWGIEYLSTLMRHWVEYNL
jgi:hypothetical protein